MKKTILVATSLIIGGLLLTTSTSMALMGQGKGQGFARTNSGTMNSNYSTYGVNVIRSVTNISNGVEITLTTSDTATLEHMKTMFTQNALKSSINPLIKTERVQLINGTKLTITSTDTNTIKLIQDKAAAAKSGAFGNAGKGQMSGKGQGQGKGIKGQGGCINL